MKQGWEIKKLGEVCDVITKGTTPTSLGFKFTDEGSVDFGYELKEDMMDFFLKYL